MASLIALWGQLALLAHGVLVAHVTCGVDGELVHVRAEGGGPPSAGTTARAAGDSGGDDHERCLLDEDGEAAVPTTYVASGEPVPPRRVVHAVGRRHGAGRPRAPLYRLAPKNSPPA